MSKISLVSKNFILIKTINLYFWRSYSIPLSIAFFSPLYVILVSLIYQNAIHLIAPSISIISIITLGMGTIPLMMVEIKNMTIVKKYFLEVNKCHFKNLIPLVFFVPFMFLSYFWNLFWIFIITKINNNETIFANVYWGGIIFGLLWNILISSIIGSTLYIFINSTVVASLISGLLTLFTLFLSGLMVPISLINTSEIAKVFSYFSPFRYTAALIIESWNNGTDSFNVYSSNIFQFNLPYTIKEASINQIDSVTYGITLKNVEVYKPYDKYLNIIIPIIIFIFLFIIAIKTKLIRRK